MDNLDDYILSFHDYKDGNYDYETIMSLDDIQNAILGGKKFVFIITGAKIIFIIGLIFFSIGLTIATIMYMFSSLLIEDVFFACIPSLIAFLIFTSASVMIIIPGFLRLRKSFMVLGPEGIVYKKKFGSVKGFTWEEISIGFYRSASLKKTMEKTHVEIESFRVNREIEYLNSFLIVISLPNGDSIEFGRGDYTLKEFPDKKQIGRVKANALLLLTFANYYNYRKKGMFDVP